jgi:EAL domain-containing protein (putative c-di-GMP-specific phosphodiesterase class I)
VYVSFSGFDQVEKLAGHLGAEHLFRAVINKLKCFLGTTAKLYSPIIGYGLVFVVSDIDEFRLKKKLIKIISLLSGPLHIYKEVYYISARVGVYKATDQVIAFKQAVRNARCALPREDGHIAFYSSHIEDHDQDRFFLQDKLEYAIDNNEFSLVYQGIHGVEDGKMIGVEALLRWSDLLDDDIAPQEFMPIANRSARVQEINSYVIQKALSDFKSWISSDFISEKFKVWFNVSVHQLRMGFVSQLMAHLDEFELDPKNFLVEIEESELINDIGLHVDDLLQVSSLGLGVAIDAFGCDLGCLKLITDGRCDFVKIDRGLVSGICSDKSKEILVSCLVDLAHKSGLGVIAVGVESRAHAQVLQKLGCTFAQGFLYSRPAVAEEIVSSLQLHQN